MNINLNINIKYEPCLIDNNLQDHLSANCNLIKSENQFKYNLNEKSITDIAINYYQHNPYNSQNDPINLQNNPHNDEKNSANSIKENVNYFIFRYNDKLFKLDQLVDNNVYNNIKKLGLI